MKFYSLLYYLCFITIIQSCSNTKSNGIIFEKNKLSDVDTVLTYTIGSNWVTKIPIIKLSAKNNIWTVSKYRVFINQLYEDSLTYSCNNCPQVFDQIIKLGLLELPNETELPMQCISYKHEMYNGDTVVKVTTLDGISDLRTHKIEYRIGNKCRTLVYRDPAEALIVCPDSEERIKFLKIIKLIEGL